MKKCLFAIAFIAATFGENDLCRAQYYTIDTIAGNGSTGVSTDGVPATNTSIEPLGLSLDAAGNVYVIDRNSVRKIDGATGIITTITGNGTPGFSGDGGPATSATISCSGGTYPSQAGLFCDLSGNVYIADVGNGRIRKIDAITNIITTVAGGGTGGDGSLATAALLTNPTAVTTDAAGNMYIANSNVLKKVNVSTGIINTITGSGSTLSGDGGPASAAGFGNTITDVKVDNAGNIYVEDNYFVTYTVRKIDAVTTTVSTIVGGSSGTPGLYGIPGSMVSFAAASHYGFCLDRSGNLYVGDGLNGEIYRLDMSTGLIYSAASSSLGGAVLYLAADTFGNIYYSNRLDVVQKYTPQHSIFTTFYVDMNSNCTFDAGDDYDFLPVTSEIDSNGVPVDTIVSTSGFYYVPNGHPGDIYTIKVLSAPPGLVLACPSSGVVYDTLRGDRLDYANNVGFNCSATTSFDIGIYTSLYARTHVVWCSVLAFNMYCPPKAATVTLTGTAKYQYVSLSPSPYSTSGNVATWNFSGLTASPLRPAFMDILWAPTGSTYPPPGDTIQTNIQITPITGDMNPTNNTISQVDTVRGGYDPNFIDVTPSGYIPAGTNLQYSIHFENTGNDTAYNVYVIDTLSDYLDIHSLKMMGSSAVMNIKQLNANGHNILRFEFLNINLLDSSHHGQCDAMFVFSIKTKTGLANGTIIPNNADIYFDENSGVWTDTAQNIVGIPSEVPAVRSQTEARVYPNPATSELTITTGTTAYSSLTITNTMGQPLIRQQINTALTKVEINDIPAGLYFITLKSENGNIVRKFVKL